MAIRPFKEHFAKALAEHLPLDEEQVLGLIEYPPDKIEGDLGFPCFTLARTLKKSPKAIAEEVAGKIEASEFLAKVFAVGPYVNVNLNKEKLAKAVFAGTLENPEKFGAIDDAGKTMVIDYSSPNIAKPFHVGHLRSTIIGNALKNFYSHLGWKVIGINHLGDWGTQFGKLIVAYRKWGEEEKLRGAEPVKYLEELYVKFHKELETNEALDDEARAAFKALEEGAEEERKLWKLFTDMSLKKFYEVYGLLNVDFDHDMGESFYEDKVEPAIKRLEDAGLAQESDGALVVKLEEHNMPACLLRKSDGATLYATRDLAAAFYRQERFSPDRMLYVHGMPQDLHFRQFFKVLEMYDKEYAGKMHFAGFGQIRFQGLKLSTRAGNVIHLEDVISEGIRRSNQKLDEAEAEGRVLENRDDVARDVALAALIFGDLSSDRIKDIAFDWDRALEAKGDTGPCVQYAHARARSLIRKNGAVPVLDCKSELLTEAEEGALLKEIAIFPEVVEQAAEAEKPHMLAQHLLKIASAWNSYYHSHPGIIKLDDDLRQARVALVGAIAETLKLGLSMLGIPAPQEM